MLKNKFRYEGLVITDALNMNAVAKKYPAGELDLRAFKAGNDVLLFSQDVPTGKKLIKEALQKGEISEKRLEESVKKILKTKYLLGLQNLRPLSSEGINNVLNNDSHAKISEKLYANALTLLKDEKQLFPLREKEVYYLPLEEASHEAFLQELSKEIKVKKISFKEIQSIPENAVVIIGLHKDNSTAYKPYKVSWESKRLISQLKSRNKVILNVFGSPYALQDVDISGISSILVSYENNPLSMKATAEAYLGKQKINGRLPVVVNEQIKYGMGIDIPKQK